MDLSVGACGAPKTEGLQPDVGGQGPLRVGPPLFLRFGGSYPLLLSGTVEATPIIPPDGELAGEAFSAPTTIVEGVCRLLHGPTKISVERHRESVTGKDRVP